MVGLIQLPVPASPAAGTQGSPAVPVDAAPAGGPELDPLNTVGLALLAYGLVQLLSKVIDKLPAWRGGGDAPAAANGAAGFTAEDRKRLERVLEQVSDDHVRLERLQETVREIHEATRRARGLGEQVAVTQRLTGQALDELREVQAKLDNVLRKLRALWFRVGRRRKDKG
jgi:chromosome segregation ATPase